MKKRFLDLIFVVTGAFLLAFAVQVFWVPAQISTGGLSGVGMALFYVVGIPVFLTVLVLNLVLIVIGFSTLPFSVLTKNFVGILFLSLFLRLLQNVPLYSEDLFLSSVFGGVVGGLGVGLVLRCDASTGGTDLAALMLHKKFLHVSPSFFIMAIDTVVILVTGFLFEDTSLTLYSLLSLYISNRVVDQILVLGDRAKAVTVVSRKSDEIASDIMHRLNRGVTGIFSRGYYEGREGKMLYCVVRSRQVPKLLSLVRRLDPDAFTVVMDAVKVRGEGF